MDDVDPTAAIDDREDKRAFGGVKRASRLNGATFSSASQEAAANLLHKATRALEADDAGRAQAFVDRALGLPFDDHEKTVPAVWVAHSELFDMLTDVLEDGDADDSIWLDAALDVLDSADDTGRQELCRILDVIDNDFEVNGKEHQRIRHAISAVPAGTPAEDLRLPPRRCASTSSLSWASSVTI